MDDTADASETVTSSRPPDARDRPSPAWPTDASTAPEQAASADRRRDQPEADRTGSVVRFITDKAIPLLIALCGAVGALAGLGVKATVERNDSNDTVASLERQNEVLQEQNDALTDEVEVLTEDRDRWQDRAEGGTVEESSSDTPETTTSGADDSPILRQTGDTPVTISRGYAIDLDSDAPDWAVTEYGSSETDLEFAYSTSTDYQVTGEQLALMERAPTLEECVATTDLQTSMASREVRADTDMCVRTNQGRFAWVHIVEADLGEDGSLTIDLVVWE